MEPNGQGRSGARDLNSFLKAGLIHHEARARHDSFTVCAQDGQIHVMGNSKIIASDDEVFVTRESFQADAGEALR
jgi:hypothetical protein